MVKLKNIVKEIKIINGVSIPNKNWKFKPNTAMSDFLKYDEIANKYSLPTIYENLAESGIDFDSFNEKDFYIICTSYQHELKDSFSTEDMYYTLIDYGVPIYEYINGEECPDGYERTWKQMPSIIKQLKIYLQKYCI